MRDDDDGVDPDDIGAFLDALRPFLIASLYRRGFRTDVEDSAEEALTEGYARWAAHGSWAEAGVRDPRAWMAQVAYHAALRATRAREVPTEDVPEPGADHGARSIGAPAGPADPTDVEAWAIEVHPRLVASLRKSGYCRAVAEASARDALVAAHRWAATEAWRRAGKRTPRMWTWREAYTAAARRAGPDAVPDDEPLYRPDDDVDPASRRDALLYDAAIRGLAEQRRRVFVLTMDGFAPGEIADVLGMKSKATARSHLRFARIEVTDRLVGEHSVGPPGDAARASTVRAVQEAIRRFLGPWFPHGPTHP